MRHSFEAVISESSGRYHEWVEVLGTNRVAVCFPNPQKANLPGLGERDVYFMQLSALTEEQRARLVSHISQKFNVPISEVDREIYAHGVPILADDVTVFIDPRFF